TVPHGWADAGGAADSPHRAGCRRARRLRYAGQRSPRHAHGGRHANPVEHGGKRATAPTRVRETRDQPGHGRELPLRVQRRRLHLRGTCLPVRVRLRPAHLHRHVRWRRCRQADNRARRGSGRLQVRGGRGGPLSMRRAKGFTIIELLIAGAILVVLLAALGRVYVGSMRAYRTNEAVSTERQNLQAVTELLQYEIGLAGYRCADSVSAALNRVFSGPPLTAAAGSSVGPD